MNVIPPGIPAHQSMLHMQKGPAVFFIMCEMPVGCNSKGGGHLKGNFIPVGLNTTYELLMLLLQLDILI